MYRVIVNEYGLFTAIDDEGNFVLLDGHGDPVWFNSRNEAWQALVDSIDFWGKE